MDERGDIYLVTMTRRSLLTLQHIGWTLNGLIFCIKKWIAKHKTKYIIECMKCRPLAKISSKFSIHKSLNTQIHVIWFIEHFGGEKIWCVDPFYTFNSIKHFRKHYCQRIQCGRHMAAVYPFYVLIVFNTISKNPIELNAQLILVGR